MTTLISNRLRDGPEGLILMTALCIAVIAIEFKSWTSYGEHLAKYESQLEHLDVLNKSYSAGKVSYEVALAAYEDAQQKSKYLDEDWKSSILETTLVSMVLLLFYPIFANGQFSSLGMCLAPTQGWRYWCILAPTVGLLVACLAAPAIGIWLCFGWQMGINSSFDWNYSGVTADIGVRAPITEELIYRMGVCAPVSAWLGPRTSIVISGVLFALIHVLYGNANPINVVSGFVLAWAYLKSNTILVPIILHGLGNLLAWLVVTVWLLPLLG